MSINKTIIPNIVNYSHIHHQNIREKSDLLKILLIEDNLAEARLLQEYLKDTKSPEFSLFHVQRLQEAIRQLTLEKYDIILLDLTLPDSQELSSIPSIIEKNSSIPIIILTNINDEEIALAAIKKGAQDYLFKKQITPDLLVHSIRYAIERKQLLEQLRIFNQTLETKVEERTEELLKAQQINRFKSQFLSMLSHDIRNPLNTILLGIGLIQNSDRNITEDNKNHLRLIRSAIKNLTQLLEEASFISQYEIGKLQFKPQMINIENLCCELVAQTKILALEKNLNLVFTTLGTPRKLLLDEKLIRHILNNLLSNAVKYSLANSQILFELQYQEKNIIFKIQDGGIGISLQNQNQIFQPFYRGENVGSIPGNGLGLAIVKYCVNIHQGEITVNSNIGTGSTFTVILPI